EDGIRDFHVTGVQTCALPISVRSQQRAARSGGAVQRSAVRSYREETAAQRAGPQHPTQGSGPVGASPGARGGSGGGRGDRAPAEIGRAAWRGRVWGGGVRESR